MHLTQACRKYEKFVRDNPITSSRRTTPVQDHEVNTNIQGIKQRPLFPHLPTQCFEPPVIPPVETRTQPQGSKHEPSFVTEIRQEKLSRKN